MLAIDEGTTGVRALVVDRDGRAAGQGYREIGITYPRPGWVEQDPQEIFDRTVDVVREALDRALTTAAAVAAVGVTGQRSTAVVWSRRTGHPLCPALSWQDLRAAERSAELLERGHFLTPLAAALKLEWMMKNLSAVRRATDERDALFGTIESWLIWKLSGGTIHATDASFAATSGLYDFFEKRWSTALLDDLGLGQAALPEIRPSSDDYGRCDPSLFGAAVPISGVAGDQQAATFGQVCFEPGQAKVSYGTSAMADRNVGSAIALSAHGAYPLVLWKIGDETVYCLEGQVSTAGAALQWLRDGLGILPSAAESDRLAWSVADTGGVWAVPAFQGLGTPHQDAGARAAFGGLSRGSTRAHVVRAVLEGVALRVREVVEALAADFPVAGPEVLRVDGGAAANDFLLQFQSDVLGIPVERPESLDAAGIGAAFLAGLAVGFWPDLDAIRDSWRPGARFEPQMTADEREERYARFCRVVRKVREIGAG